MADLSPDLSARIARLLPRLASPSDGEVVAAVAALRRTLERAGLDLHDLAARLAERPTPAPRPGTSELAFRRMADELRLLAADRLRPHEVDFVSNCARRLAAERRLSPSQAAWLSDLHERLVAEAGHA